jgi:hypothetical protein
VVEWWSSDDLDSLWSAVYAQSRGALPKLFQDLIGLIGRPAFIAAAEVGAAVLEGALVAALIAAGPVGAAVATALAAAGAALDVQLASDLVEVLYDIPNDITTQVINAFAFDCVNPGDSNCVDAAGNPIKDPLEDDNFKNHPGVGRTVSPDNIHMFWDPPSIANVDGIRGIYGFNMPAQIVKGVTMVPICRRIPSTGTATITGLVKYSEGQRWGLLLLHRISTGANRTASPTFHHQGKIRRSLQTHREIRGQRRHRHWTPRSRPVWGSNRAHELGSGAQWECHRAGCELRRDDTVT